MTCLSTGNVHQNSLGPCEFCENWHSESHSFFRGVNDFYIRTSHVSSLICVKFSIRDLHIMLLSIYDNFHKNWCREGLFFLWV
jgi:hypothetical protein